MSGLRSSPWTVLAVLCTGHAMVLLDNSIVNIAVPSIVDGLHASLDQVLWMRSAYTLAFAVLLITSGRLGDRRGPRSLFVMGLIAFTASSVVCGLAQTPEQLIGSRVAQGVGAAMLAPQPLVILTAIFPPHRRGAAFGIWSAIAASAALAGPVVGGVITTFLDWRWVFFVNVPIGAVVFLGTLTLVPDHRPGRTAGAVEPVGVLLVTAGFLALMFGLIEGQRFAWGEVTRVGGFPVGIPALITVGAIVLAAFFLWDRFQRFPLVPLTLFRERDYSVMIWVGVLLMFALIGVSLPLTIFLQSALGYTPLRAGLTLLPMALLTVVTPIVAGQMTDRVGGKYVIMTGLTLYALGLAYLAWSVSLASTWLTLLPGLAVAGVGVGCSVAPIAVVAMHRVRPEASGAAAGVLNTTQQLGGAIGAAAIGAVLQAELAAGLRDQAVRLSAQLPVTVRQTFVEAFGSLARGGLDVGRVSSSEPGLVAGLPGVTPGTAHLVFATAFTEATRWSLMVVVPIVAAAAVSCLAVRGRTAVRDEPAAAAAVSPTSTEAVEG